MKPITVWLRWDTKKEYWKHNHIEDNHILSDTPTPKSEQQETWKEQLWKKELAFLFNGKVMTFHKHDIPDYIKNN